MRKTFMMFFLCMSGMLMAQEGFHAGFKVTPQSTWMINDDNSDNSNYNYVSTWGIAYGPSFAYFFKPSVGVGMDVILSHQGQKFEERKTNAQINQLRLRYVKLPLLLHFSSSPELPVQFIGYTGPQFGFLTKAELEIGQKTPPSAIFVPEVAPFIPAEPGKYNVKSSYAKANIGWLIAFGLGTNFGTDFLGMSVLIRLDGSFTDAEKKPELLDSGGQLVIDTEAATNRAWYYYFYPSDNSLEAASRPTTYNLLGGIEIGFKYILNTGSKGRRR
ncbi:MAG: hypothetical protein KatS3mg031_1489 [Chitinophagales bacterium]|nr:MAG: hypothetical protein KatS3mg031_1489 [Chitinophagales bacterium]